MSGASDHLRPSQVTVAIPLHNYAHTLVETLESVRAQTLPDLDLVIVDDGSTDASLRVALDWVGANAGRFNRVAVTRNSVNAGLGLTRNAVSARRKRPTCLPLDADNRLRPGCCELLLAAVEASGAAFAYPVIQEFGGRTKLIGAAPYIPAGWPAALHRRHGDGGEKRVERRGRLRADAVRLGGLRFLVRDGGGGPARPRHGRPAAGRITACTTPRCWRGSPTRGRSSVR